MGNSNKSSSIEQQYAETVIFKQVEQLLGVKLEKNCKIYLADNMATYMQPDFYSESEGVIGEIFAHIGKPKKAQDNKLANDILKMLLLEKVKNKTYRKILVVCDEDELKKLKGLSVLAESIRQFNIEVMYIEIEDDLRNALITAQIRQRMTNE